MSVAEPVESGVAVVGRSAAEIAAAIRDGRLSAQEAVRSHLERIRELNPVLNALVGVDEDAALARAEAADAARARGECWGPLHGVPFTAKDALETAGMRTTCGVWSLREHRPERDAAVVARLRAGGAILLGKTNVPAFTSDYQTDNRLFGRTQNPWDPGRTPGGSSGGGAAAVAAGLTPLDVGSDVGGSIRLPAHYCGVLGFKPTSRRIPMSGHIPPLPGRRRGLRHLASIGFLARSPRDLRIALELANGPDGRDHTVPPVPLTPARKRSPGELRIAWTSSFPGLPLATAVRGRGDALAAALEAAGAAVRQVEPAGMDLLEICEVYGALFGAEITAVQPEDDQDAERLRRLRETGCPEPYARGYALGFDASVRDYTRLLHRRDDWIERVEAVLAENDAWMCPAAPVPAPPHSARGAPITVDGRAWPYVAQGWYCFPFNLTDHPAVVLPAGFVDGLPCGVQLVGRLWDDAHLLDVADSVADLLGRPPLAMDAPPAGA